MLAGQPVAFRAMMGMLFGQSRAQMDEVLVERGSSIDGVPLKEAALERHNLLVFGIVKGGEPTPGTVALRGGRYLLFNPSENARIEEGDVLILFGRAENLKRLKLELEESTLS